MAKLTKRKIDAAIVNAKNDLRLWDDDPRGLGIRIKPSGTATFFIQYRSPVTFKKVRHSIDQYGRLTIDQARKEAKDLFSQIADGVDPAKEKRHAKYAAATALTVSEFCDDYMRDAEAGLATFRGRPKKASTLAIDRGRIERHIKPTLGERLIREVTRQDIERAMHDIRLGKTATDVKTGPRGRAIVTGGAGTAARCVAFMSAIFSYAIQQGIRADNPVSGVKTPPVGRRDRVLSPDEFRRLGKALDDIKREGANPIVIRAYRVLALTGCRRGEVFGLKRSEVDFHHQCLRLGDTKTGQQVRPLGRSAIDILAMPSFDEDSDFVFPSTRGDGHLADAKTFRRVCEVAELEAVSLHTLRHSFASVALELEYSEMTVAGLLGHRSHSITSRYAHHVDRALVAAADRISTVIAERMSGKDKGRETVVTLRQRAH